MPSKDCTILAKLVVTLYLVFTIFVQNLFKKVLVVSSCAKLVVIAENSVTTNRAL